jgi:hypothetical protein
MFSRHQNADRLVLDHMLLGALGVRLSLQEARIEAGVLQPVDDPSPRLLLKFNLDLREPISERLQNLWQAREKRRCREGETERSRSAFCDQPKFLFDAC